ncbi:hypothetical protein ACSQ76_21260 [Roseovarius sp. B08]|uniref:hypothetical protein n=1 Tax=Roseovarius sp. B08 TaxID=3449223 RepID=UPI003EDBC59A
MKHASILILEDEPVIALGLETALKDYGCKSVVVCNSIRDAISEIKGHVPKGAIINLISDGSASSVDVAQWLVRQSCGVVFTADFKEEAWDDLPYRLQDCDVIEKPYRVEHVIEKLDEIVSLPKKANAKTLNSACGSKGQFQNTPNPYSPAISRSSPWLRH